MRLALAAAVLLWSAQLRAADEFRATHDALFSSFLPVAEKPELQQMFLQAREGIWQAAGKERFFLALVSQFADLRNFGDACGIPDFIKSAGTTAFDKLTPPQRTRVLFLLQTCSLNPPRRVAMSLRNFYLVRTYGALQEVLTGVKLNLYAPDSFIEQNRPKLPKTRLRYDRDKEEIARPDGEIDYLIVGSGPAGSVLSHELRRGGKRVVLVERGPFTVPGAMETRLIDELKESGGTRTSFDGGIIIKNGNAVGGGSLVNVDLCFAPTLPSIQFKIDSWKRDGRIGATDFTLPELAKAYEWVKASVGTRVLQESEINPNNRALWDGAKQMGLHPKLYDLNTYAPGKSPSPVTDKRSGEHLVIEALQDESNPLSFVPDADVQRVLFDDHMKATGVQFAMRTPLKLPGVIGDPNGLGIRAGATVTIHARNVILSAGSLGSPAILLRSGVKNDQIGRGAVLHVALPLMGLFDQTIDVLSGTQASVFVDDNLISDGYALEAMSAEPLYGAVMSPGPPQHQFDMIKAYRHLAGFGVMLIDTPSPQNRVFLDSNGEPQVEYTISEDDKKRFRRGVALAARIMLKAGAKEVYLPTTEDILEDGPAGELHPVVISNAAQTEAIEKKPQFVSNRTMMSTAHLQATNKMGTSARDSVVSRDFRVWGTEGLYVVDGSIFPTSIGANPMQSIYTFAKIFTDRMK